MDNQQVKTYNFYWLVGFIDGEGSFMMMQSRTKGLTTPRYQPYFKLAGTDFQTFLDVQAIFKEHNLPYHVEIRQHPQKNQKTSWMIVMSGYKRMWKFFSIFTPDMFKTKSTEARQMYDFLASRISTYSKAPYTEFELLCIEKLRNKKVRLDFNDYTRNVLKTMV